MLGSSDFNVIFKAGKISLINEQVCHLKLGILAWMIDFKVRFDAIKIGLINQPDCNVRYMILR